MRRIFLFSFIFSAIVCWADADISVNVEAEKIAASEAEFEKIFWQNHAELGLDRLSADRELASEDAVDPSQKN